MIIGRIKLTSGRSAGFSMIDVLVAIIVLATALLALAALQGALTRNSADARSRSQIAAYSEGLIDQMRTDGYDNIVTATVTPSNATGATASAKEAYNTQTAAGVSNLKTTITATSYYGSNASVGATFNTAAPSNLATYTPRYKQVNVTTTWNDATGQARTLAVDTLVSPVAIDTSNALDSQSLAISGSTSPIVREYNPGATAGVIPIAIGSTQQTAATNPKPELLALNGNNSAVVGTSFNVLTFKNADANNDTVIQQRVDTLVIACSCKYGGSVTVDNNSDFATVITQPYRPTYWDGTQYVAPTAVSGTTTSPTGVDSSATQSPYCDVCCRDHNDKSTDTVKFDPWITDANYSHYYYNSSDVLTAVAPSDTAHAYLNACRLIRVNGQYAVATDMNNYFFGLLATSSPSSASTAAKSPIPDSTDTTDFGAGGATAQYQAFVLNYLQTNIASLEGGTIPSVSTTASTYAASPYNLDRPASISITYSATTTDYRYLHARGIYVDHLEPAAATAIGNAITSCTSSTVSDCFLPILPFTTINLSEIANWSVTTTSTNCANPALAVSVNNASIVNEDFNASRGVVTARSCAANAENSTVQASIGNSNSGIAATGTGFANPIDPTDAANFQTDTQAFQKSGGVTAGGGSVSATLTLTPSTLLPQLAKGYLSTYPSVSWQLDSVAAPTGSLTACTANSTGKGGNTQLTNYTCPAITTAATPPTAASMTVIAKNYNYAYTATGANPCWSGHNATVQYCSNYRIDTSAILVNGTTVGSVNVSYTNEGNVGNTTLGTTAEQASIAFPSLSLSSTDTVSIGFQLQATNASSYTCSGNQSHTVTYAGCN